MFTRTARLLLRPGWAEDAPALVEALGDQRIVRNLAKAPWPYRREHAEDYLASTHDPVLPSLLVFERTRGAPVLVGGCGLGRTPSGGVQIGYWITVRYWGRGYATEAARAVVDIARALQMPRLQASFYLDNPASGRVLEKLGFAPTGVTAPLMSRGRGCEAPARMLALDLRERGEIAEAIAA